MDAAVLAAELARRGMCDSEAEALRVIEAFDERKIRRGRDGKFASKPGALKQRSGRTAPGSGKTGAAQVRAPGETARAPKPGAEAKPDATPSKPTGEGKPDTTPDGDGKGEIGGKGGTGLPELTDEDRENVRRGVKVMQKVAKAIPRPAVKKWYNDLGAFSATKGEKEVLAPGVENDPYAVTEALHRTELIMHEGMQLYEQVHAAAASVAHLMPSAIQALMHSADDDDDPDEPIVEDAPSD